MAKKGAFNRRHRAGAKKIGQFNRTHKKGVLRKPFRKKNRKR